MNDIVNTDVKVRNYFTNAERDDGNDVAFGMFRSQPVTDGHADVVNRMCRNHKTVIVGLGSAQTSGVEGNPFTVDDRMAQWRNIFGDRIKLVPVTDLGTCDPQEWVNFVINKITKVGLPEPTDYYGGLENACWYRSHFLLPGEKEANLHYTSKGVLRKIHVMTRETPISGTEVRNFIQLRMDVWKRWVPVVNHRLIEERYPEHLRIPKK